VRVLVTGAAGYIGSAVSRALLSAGHEVVATIRRDAPGIAAAVETRSADLDDASALVGAIGGYHAVCHLAGLTRARESVERALGYFATNMIHRVDRV
jgi:nucleoside-diphosphate-sugar epimerase